MKTEPICVCCNILVAERDTLRVENRRQIAQRDALTKERDEWRAKAERWALAEAALVEQGIRTAADWLSGKQALEHTKDALADALEALLNGFDHVVYCARCGETDIEDCAETNGADSNAAKALAARADAKAALRAAGRIK